MKFEMENELLPAGRPRNGRRNIVMIACTAVICVLLIIVYVRHEHMHEAVNRQESRPGYEPGFRGPDRRQLGAPGEAGPPGEPGSPAGPKLKTGTAGALVEVKTSTGGIKNLTASKGVVEGIIAGTSSGLVIIHLDSREQITISSKDIRGVAFNWESRKVYWIEVNVGIKIADLDGSHAELLISDPNLQGLAVDHITENLYYGERGSSAKIRVCDSMGKKCVTVAWGVNNVGQYIWDIALLPSEGLMFWSSPHNKRTVTRANMNGTNATTIILENVYGIYLDDVTGKLYWADVHGKSIGYRDLNGYNRNVLLNTTMNPIDIAVDGDTMYFGGQISNGVYSVTSNGQVSSIAITTGYVYHIAFFGRNKVSSRANPCNNSFCARLCVLTRISYACL